MGDEDFIQGLQAAVKREVIERYVRERRILEEEINMVLEAASAWHGAVAAWEYLRQRLSAVLVSPAAARRFFTAAGLGPEPDPPLRPLPRFPRPPGLTLQQRYRRLVAELFAQVVAGRKELAAEREQVAALMEEVNQDIRTFEANHDLMAISAYLRSLDPAELQRRKILGVNFTAAETALSAAALSFRPIDPQRLLMGYLAPAPEDPELPPQALEVLRQICRRHRWRVQALWSRP